jgi:hypothetical protein
MTTPVWTELVCGTCATTTSGRYAFNGRIEVKAMKSEAKAIGWTFKHDECFCSKNCLTRYEAENPDKLTSKASE